ncbi:AAA family ATPase [Marinitoga sp. 1135]|uniref:AAA family ATPase n=1 Tax=Marinitoga sp. 1135 TaxID=1643333 RepID=UPI001C31C3AC|nr:AAA family ATPase [Marinitoga sp. 1135]
MAYKGWTKDIFLRIKKLDKDIFTSKDFYNAFLKELEKIHSNNKNVKPTILREFQNLRDDNLLEFVDNNGTYKVINKSKWEEELNKLSETPDKKISNNNIDNNPNTNDVNKIKKEIFLPDEEIDKILELIKRKKNVIFQGPPGVGKTFIAKKMGNLMGIKDDNIEIVQFHQSYSYEDFIIGYRPTENGSFILKKGIFYKFIEKAKKDPENSYLFIIDEINRGNLSKIFGELMMLIEKDKRGEKNKISLTYNENKKFYIPENVYIIGTMNTADRSLAMVDYALRRRFSFVTIKPAFSNNKFEDFLKNKRISVGNINKLRNKIENLNNKEIKEAFGEGFEIGHSYFVSENNIDDFKYWYNDIIKYEILPLLEEYWFNDPEKLEEIRKKLDIEEKDWLDEQNDESK